MENEIKIIDKNTLDLSKVQAVIDDDSITYGEIVKFTGMSKGAIRPYRIGEREVAKMQIENALKFQELYDKTYMEEKNMQIKEWVIYIKEWNEFSRKFDYNLVASYEVSEEEVANICSEVNVDLDGATQNAEYIPAEDLNAFAEKHNLSFDSINEYK